MHSKTSGRQLRQAGLSQTAVRPAVAAALLHRGCKTARTPVVWIAAPEKAETPVSLSSSEDVELNDTTGVLLVQCPGRLQHVAFNQQTQSCPPDINQEFFALLQMPRVWWHPLLNCCLASTAISFSRISSVTSPCSPAAFSRWVTVLLPAYQDLQGHRCAAMVPHGLPVPHCFWRRSALPRLLKQWQCTGTCHACTGLPCSRPAHHDPKHGNVQTHHWSYAALV